MALREIIKYPDPILKKVAITVESFDQDLHQLLDDMAETMYGADGIGLAAPQIGISKRVIVVDISRDGGSRIELINPVITKSNGETDSEEGCLSIPGYRDVVSRNQTIEVEFLDRHGQMHRLDAEELMSFCIQHEIDHLDGILFIDRLSRLKRELFKRQFQKKR